MTAPDHPYVALPNTAFWSRAVARGWDAGTLAAPSAPLLVPDDRIVSAGSCFAANIVPHIEAAGYEYVRTERFAEEEDRFNYGDYSAAYGNIYTARQFRQLIERCLGRFMPLEDRWILPEAVIDPFRPGLPFPAEDEAEFNLATAAHLERTREAFLQATVLVFTLGLTEAWASSLDGAVFPACPGVVAGAFDASRHGFVNFRVGEIVEDLRAALALLREINPQLRTLLTVSPVPLAATATGSHVYVANFYSKAALRAAAEEVAASEPRVAYFPALEIVLGPQVGANLAPNLRNVSADGVARVVAALFQRCRLPPDGVAAARGKSLQSAQELSRRLVLRECEERLNDDGNALAI